MSTRTPGIGDQRVSATPSAASLSTTLLRTARTPVAGSVTASMESVAPMPYMAKSPLNPNRLEYTNLWYFASACSTKDHPGGCATSATTCPSSRPSTRPGVRRVTVGGSDGSSSGTVQNGWSSGAASIVNAFMHQYGEPAELYDSAMRRLS